MNAPDFPNRRRRTLAKAALALCAAGTAPLHAQSGKYPDRRVRILVGYAAGTAPDIVARLLAQKLSEHWGGISVVVDNKAGAAGAIAAGEAARARADGYTLMLGNVSVLAIMPHTHTKLAYDASKDFVPVSQIGNSDFMLLVNPQRVPARDARQFVEWARNEKHLVMGSFGAGSPGHLGTHIFGEATGLKPEVIQYNATGDAIIGMVNGDVAGTFTSVGLSLPNIKSGRLISLGSTGPSRNPNLLDVPTFAEQGFPTVRFSSWHGIVAPAGTPPEIIAKLESDIRAAMQGEGRTKLEAAGFRAASPSTEEFRRFIAGEHEIWGRVVTKTGLRIN